MTFCWYSDLISHTRAHTHTHTHTHTQQHQCLKQYVDFNTQKIIEAEINGDKDGKVLDKLTKNAVYEKTMENVRNRTDIKLTSNRKDYLKWTSKPSFEDV